MIDVIQEIEKDWFLIHLKDTRHYQIWNKWDLYEVLLNATSYSANNRKPFLDLYDDDFPMTKQDLTNMVGELKRVKEDNNKKYNN
jgi:hypothetical protein